MIKKIKELAERFHPMDVATRRHIHRNPELSFEEHNTAKYVESQLEALEIPTQRMAGTGVIGLLKGEGPGQGQVFALRADLDALPITEKNTHDFVSQNPGVMHACGHDVHSTSLLGAARILSELKNEWSGTLKLIFQPGEEKAPGGASLLIKEGVLENPEPKAIMGQHVMPLIDVGKVGFRSGKYMASADEIYLTVIGKGGHGGMPQFTVDPVLISAHIITGLQQVVSRNAPPTVPTVLSFGRVEALGANNVIPDEVKLAGTLRTFDEAWRGKALEILQRMASSIAEGMGGKVEFNIVRGYPYLVNEAELTNRARSYATEFLGPENVEELDLWMAAEDFSYYSQVAPACFYRLGIRNEQKGIVSGVHTPTFDIDEEALKIGTGLLAYMAYKEMGNS